MCSIFKGAPLLLVACLLSPLGAADWKTATPIIYNIDYRAPHVGSAEYLKTITEAPPQLLHVGEDVAFSSVYGTKDGYAGNKAKLLTAEEARAKIAALKEYTASLHHAGVEWVIPYINNKAAIGSHIKRNGIWEFFDHWNDFAEFGFGPRPSEDMVLAQMHYPFRRPRALAAHLAPYQIYHMCGNNPNWRRWLLGVTANIARCGYDGVFMDEPELRDYCVHCREKFRAYLEQKYTPAERRRRFGRADAAAIGMGYAGDGALWYDTQAFWSQSVADLFKAIGDEGRKTNPAFFVVPNYITMATYDGISKRIASGKDPSLLAPQCRLMMFEEKHRPGHLTEKVFFDYRLQYKLAFAVGFRAGILSYMAQEPAGIELGIAEAGAGGGGALIQPYYSAPESRQKYRRFFAGRRDLFDGFDSYADVAVVFGFDELYWSNATNLQSVYRLSEYLSNEHVLFDLIQPKDVSSRRLARYRAVITPGVKYLRDRVLSELKMYAAGGGVWLDVAHSGQFDQSGQVRVHPDKEPATEPLGNGVILRRGELDEVVRYPKFALYLMHEEDEITNMKEVADALESVRAAQAPPPPSSFTEDLRKLLERHVHGPLSVLPEAGREGLRVDAYRKDDAVVCHFVNYYCPLPMKVTFGKGKFDIGQPAEEIAPRVQEKIPVRLRLHQAAATSVRAYDPDAQDAQPLAFSQNGDAVEFTLPSVRIYKIVEVKLR